MPCNLKLSAVHPFSQSREDTSQVRREAVHLLTAFDKFDSHLFASSKVNSQLHEAESPFVQISDLHATDRRA